MNLPSALLAPLLLVIAPPLASENEIWAGLEVPSLCIQPAADIGPIALGHGSHIALNPAEDGPLRSERRSYRLPISGVMEILEGDALRRGRSLRFRRPAPPLLARGTPETIEGARLVLGELEAVAEEQLIELEATLVRRFEGQGPVVSVSAPPAEFAQTPGARAWTRTVRSGDDVSFGNRTEQNFLSGFDVQVAAGSESPDPTFGSIASGETVHLRAWRTAGGAAVYVEGWLDLSVAEREPDFDPGTADLGRIEKPVVHVAQVAFAGEVPSGGALRVAVRGAPRGSDEWTLWVAARTQPDQDRGWRALDLALLESTPAELPLPHPGFGVPKGAAFLQSPTYQEPLTASALWGEVEMSLAAEARGGGRSRRPLLAYAPGLLIGPAENGGIWQEALSLARAAEGARTRTAGLTVTAGDVTVRLPVSTGSTTRVLVGTERLFVTDYRLEIAPESWIAAPIVSKAWDGALVQGRIDGDAFPCAWWSVSSKALAPLERGDTTHGAVERIRRAHRAGRDVIRLSAPATEFVAAEGNAEAPPSLHVVLSAR